MTGPGAWSAPASVAPPRAVVLQWRAQLVAHWPGGSGCDTSRAGRRCGHWAWAYGMLLARGLPVTREAS